MSTVNQAAQAAWAPLLAGALMQKHHALVRELLAGFPMAREISTAGDSFFLVFDSPSNAVLFSAQLHSRLRSLSKQEADLP